MSGVLYLIPTTLDASGNRNNGDRGGNSGGRGGDNNGSRGNGDNSNGNNDGSGADSNGNSGGSGDDSNGNSRDNSGGNGGDSNGNSRVSGGDNNGNSDSRNSDNARALAAVLPAPVRERAGALASYIGENAKTTRAFLKRVGTVRPIQEIEIHELNVNTPASEIDRLLAPLLAGIDTGLVSEAGCPAVADPGALLVRRAHERGIRVVPLVGPSSILLALMACGLNGQSFAFHGYLSVNAAERARQLRDLEQHSRKARQTQIFIETPYRNRALLDALLATCAPSTLVCVAADLTLPTETIASRTVSAWKKAASIELHKRPAIFLMLAE